MAVLLALLSAVAYGSGDFFGGLSARRLPAAAVALRTNTIGLLGLLLAAPLVGAATVGVRDVLAGAASGLAGAVGILLLYRGLAQGVMSLVAPITAAVSTVVPVTWGLVSGDRPSALGLAGIPLSLVAVVLLARDPDGPGRASGLSSALLFTALGAGAGFGLFFVGLDVAGDDAGLWPVVAGRAASVTLFALVAVIHVGSRVGGPAARTGSTPLLLLGCGLLDAGANAAFLLATHRGSLTLVAVITALYPASTLLLARIVLDERLARVQVVGVVLAGAAVALVSIG